MINTDGIKSCIEIAESEGYNADDTRKELKLLEEWYEAVEEACIVNWVEMTTPTETIQNLISWNVKMALDPKISKEANDLIELGRKMK